MRRGGDSSTGQLSSPPSCPLSHLTIVMPHPHVLAFFSLVGVLSLTGAKQNFNNQFDEQQLIMGGSKWMKKKEATFFQSAADLSACFPCPFTTCYSLPFPSSLLSDMLAHPSPFSPSLPPLWLVRSQDKEMGWRENRKRQRKKRGQEVTKNKGRGCTCTGTVFYFPHVKLSLPCSCTVTFYSECSAEFCSSCK